MVTPYDVLIRGGQVVNSESIRDVDLAIKDGAIAAVDAGIDPRTAAEVVDARGHLVFPGIIDAHNHPYYEDDIEQFSLAAAHGGVTTLVAFAGRPFGTPATDVLTLADDFIRDGSARSYLDFGLHVILTPGDDPSKVLGPLVERGVTSFKAFLAFGRQGRMFPDDRLFELMREVAKVGGMCMVHCENGPVTEYLEDELRRLGQVGAEDYIRSRPPQTESESVYRALTLAELAGCDCYIVHLSAAESVALLERSRGRPGPQRYAETAPHYLVFDCFDQVRQGGYAKISPPMRDPDDREALWRFLMAGTIDVVASDASGQTRARKALGGANYFDVPYGIPGVEQMFPVIFTEALRRGIPPTMLARVFAERPAQIFGLTRKGYLRPGSDADLLIVDPNARWVLRGADQHGNSDYSIYEGREVQGRPIFSMQRGHPVLRDRSVVARPGAGTYLPRRPRRVPGAAVESPARGQ